MIFMLCMFHQHCEWNTLWHNLANILRIPATFSVVMLPHLLIDWGCLCDLCFDFLFLASLEPMPGICGHSMDIAWVADCQTNSDVVSEDTRLARNSQFLIFRVTQMIILFYGPGEETCFNCLFYFLIYSLRTVTVPGTDRRLHSIC